MCTSDVACARVLDERQSCVSQTNTDSGTAVFNRRRKTNVQVTDDITYKSKQIISDFLYIFFIDKFKQPYCKSLK